MKQRAFLATALSLWFHFVLFGLNWNFLKEKRITTPKFRHVTITMSYKEQKPSVGSTIPEKRKIMEPERTPRKETDHKEILKPAESEKVAVEPGPFEPEVKKTERLENDVSDDTTPGIESPIANDPETKNTVSGFGNASSDTSAASFIQEAIPRYRDNPPPVYPRVARRRGHQGTVLLEVLVDRNGGVQDLRVLQSSGYTTLDEAALASVKNWSFEPGMKGSSPMDMWVRLPVRFQLK